MVGSPLRPSGFIPRSSVLRLPLSPATGVGCSPLFTEIRTQTLPACAGGYYGTSEPKEPRQGFPGYFPDSDITALCLSARTPLWASTPHTFYSSLMKVASVPGIRWQPTLLFADFGLRSVMARPIFHPMPNFKMKLCSRSPYQTCRSRLSAL